MKESKTELVDVQDWDFNSSRAEREREWRREGWQIVKVESWPPDRHKYLVTLERETESSEAK